MADDKDSSPANHSPTYNDILKLALWSEIRPLVFMCYNWRSTLIAMLTLAIMWLGGEYIDKTWQSVGITVLFCASVALIGFAIAAIKLKPESMFPSLTGKIQDDEMLENIRDKRDTN